MMHLGTAIVDQIYSCLVGSLGSPVFSVVKIFFIHVSYTLKERAKDPFWPD